MSDFARPLARRGLCVALSAVAGEATAGATGTDCGLAAGACAGADFVGAAVGLAVVVVVVVDWPGLTPAVGATAGTLPCAAAVPAVAGTAAEVGATTAAGDCSIDLSPAGWASPAGGDNGVGFVSAGEVVADNTEGAVGGAVGGLGRSLSGVTSPRPGDSTVSPLAETTVALPALPNVSLRPDPRVLDLCVKLSASTFTSVSSRFVCVTRHSRSSRPHPCGGAAARAVASNCRHNGTKSCTRLFCIRRSILCTVCSTPLGPTTLRQLQTCVSGPWLSKRR
jgi:hypothetical protein